MFREWITILCLGALAAPLSAQSASIQFFGSNVSQAIQFSPDGEWVVGIDNLGGSGFRWSSGTGYLPIAGGEGWDIVNGGGFVAGSSPGGIGKPEASTWTPGSGWTAHGNPGGGTGCDNFLSDLFTLDDSGTVGGGMSWQGCGTTAMYWTSAGGVALLPEEVASHSSRVNAISGDGAFFGGWETANFGSRRAALWNGTTNTPTFILAGPGNPDGLGEIGDINSDGTRACGVSGNSPFVWTSTGGPQILPNPPGLGGQVFANGISDDGSLVGGVSANFPQLNGWIWTQDTGSIGLADHLNSLGLGVNPNDVRNVTGVSRDGTKVCGWGNNGSFVVTFENTWQNVGNGLAGTYGEPTLSGLGTLQSGTLVRVAMTGALENAQAGLIVGLTQINAPFKGGVMVPNPDIVVSPLTTTGTGTLLVSSIWPAGVPSGFVTTFQQWVFDPAGPKGFAASNGLTGTAP
jgi:hypothetical protein